MKIVRPIGAEDLNALCAMAEETGSGFTSLPCDEAILQSKIDRSVASFSNQLNHKPKSPLYMFVLEDLFSGEVCGISAIEANVGQGSPLYHFGSSSRQHVSAALGINKEQRTFSVSTEYNGSSEVCSLYLRPGHRKGDSGKLLSKSRFLFIADYKEWFASRVIAEMRGYVDDSGNSPFYRWLSDAFLPVDFAVVDDLVGKGEKSFISEMLPGYPIPECLIPETARQFIGKVHPNTEPALAMLAREGFKNKGFYDLFDAGPTVEVDIDEIATVRNSVVSSIKMDRVQGDTSYLISNQAADGFRSIATQSAVLDKLENNLTISPDVADALRVSEGDNLRVLEV